MDDAVADEAASEGGVFSERQSEGTNDVERGAGLGVGFFAMREHGIKHDGTADGGERTRPTAAHGIGNGDAHGRGGRHAMLLQSAEEGLEVFDGDTTTCARAGNASEVGGIEAELEHAGAHARGDVAGAGGSRRHRQTAGDDGFDGGLTRGYDIVVADLEVEVLDDVAASTGGLRRMMMVRSSDMPSDWASSSVISSAASVEPTA
jgi:hypothetical protein